MMKHFFSLLLTLIGSIVFIQSGYCQKKMEAPLSSIAHFQKELNMTSLQVKNVLLAMKLNREQIDALLRDEKVDPKQRIQKLLYLTHQRDSAVNSYLSEPQRERFGQLLQNALGDKRAENRRRMEAINDQSVKEKQK